MLEAFLFVVMVSELVQAIRDPVLSFLRSLAGA